MTRQHICGALSALCLLGTFGFADGGTLGVEVAGSVLCFGGFMGFAYLGRTGGHGDMADGGGARAELPGDTSDDQGETPALTGTASQDA